ncbi:MAG: hypothetical protein JRJ73_14475 [Deltaproteobacteria bacterium]|nr:hypothetical protein [Deltaproteobacteria bacterium]
MRINTRTKRFAWLTLLCVTIMLITAPGYSKGKLEEVFSPEDNLSKALPECQVFSGTHFSAKRNYNYTFNASTKTDPKTGEVSFEFASPAYEIQAKLDKALRLKKVVYKAKNKNAINRQGHDQRVITFDPESASQITVRFLLEGNDVDEKQVGYDYFTLYLGVAHVTLQALLLNEIKDFNCDVIVPDKGWRICGPAV